MPTRIYLADLAHTYSVDDQSLTVPLGLGYIKAYAMAEMGDGVEIHLFKHPEKFIAALEDSPEVQIIGFANYGWNENLNRAIGSYARERLPDALIVAGGPNIDPDPIRRTNFMRRHDYLDYLIIDGGEEAFTEIVTWWRDTERETSNLPANVVWLDGNALQTTPERPLEKIISNIASPYLKGYLDEFLHTGMIPMFETNRGCPFKCTFCAWGSASKDLVRRLDLNQALAEIAYVGDRSTARNWIVCDANFGILKRDVEIARAIRRVKDSKGFPDKCHIWLAKNVTERNLEIGEILNDMSVPVMAVQSLNDDVLAAIKRDNISTDTYAEYQQKFHRMGNRTYSDLIVPLPNETLETHLNALHRLADFGVDIILSHNMRLLAGAETNSTETRQEFGFRTRYRLIHGDAGSYETPGGRDIRVFEYEESLRQTSTMSEEDLFYFRKLHFLIDVCWNIEVYKPLLKLVQAYGVSPITILERVLSNALTDQYAEPFSFFEHFDALSQQEWFDTRDDIEAYFTIPENFTRLINQEFEKLNVMFSILLLRDAKQSFDALILEVIKDLNLISDGILTTVSELTFARFPPLSEDRTFLEVSVPINCSEFKIDNAAAFKSSAEKKTIHLSETPRRQEVRRILALSKGKTLSKVLNTQGVALRDLQFSLDNTAVQELGL